MKFEEAMNAVRGDMDAETLADAVGTMDRAAYRALLADWKAAYAENAAAVREEKKLRKGDSSGRHQMAREFLRTKGRRMMLLRGAVSVLGRRHAVAVKAGRAAQAA